MQPQQVIILMALKNKEIQLEGLNRLIGRIIALPSKIDDLQDLGFSDSEIEELENVLALLDVEANTQLKRMKELIDYKIK